MQDESTIIAPSTFQAALAKGLDQLSDKLGNPTDCSTNAGWTVLDNVIGIWIKFFPQEVAAWKHDKKLELEIERDIKGHIKGFGYNTITYPPTLYNLIKVMLPNQDLKDKKFIRKLLISHPILKATNYKL